jgi:hypothetical protein
MNEFTRKAVELVDDLLEVRARYHAGRGHWSHAEAARSALFAHLEGGEQAARQSALEEAAKCCDTRSYERDDAHDERAAIEAEACAAAIRSLANPAERPEGDN